MVYIFIIGNKLSIKRSIRISNDFIKTIVKQLNNWQRILSVKIFFFNQKFLRFF